MTAAQRGLIRNPENREQLHGFDIPMQRRARLSRKTDARVALPGLYPSRLLTQHRQTASHTDVRTAIALSRTLYVSALAHHAAALLHGLQQTDNAGPR